MTTPNEPNKTRTIPLHIADQAVAACEAEIQKLKEENAQLKHKLGRLLGAQQEWTLVEPEHYARLKAEVERLKEEVEHTKFWNGQLKAENDLLRKAGDAMYEELGNFGMTWTFREAWKAAKEGKQS